MASPRRLPADPEATTQDGGGADLARILVSPFGNGRGLNHAPLSPRTIVELGLVSLGGAIRDKPHWNQKIKDAEISAKWRAEATAQDADPAALDYVMAENEHLAGLYPDNMYPAAVPGVFAADDYIPQELRKALMEGVEKVEGEGPPDWHPGSDEQVRDLVHPSLYPLVYGVTNQLAHDAPPLTLESCLQAMGGGVPVSELPPNINVNGGIHEDASENFQWLPAEFDVKEDGQVDILSYINNLHPKTHAPLYPVIASIFQRFVPLFNEVLTAYPTCNEPVISSYYEWYTDEPEEPEDVEEDDYDEAMEAYEEAMEEWHENRQAKQPPVPEYQPPPPPPHVVDLKGRKLQVIVKMSSIHLTPEKPEYPGGSWHLEGMLNEHIIATGIYYFDQHNITASNIAYRIPVNECFYYEQGDRRGVEQMYGLKDEGPCNQTLGSVTTLPERCICFPNNYQHRVEPFKLQDPTQPGHRKILVFWLVHPATKVHSTERVPPQQLEWLKQELYADPKFWPTALPEIPLNLVEEQWMAASACPFSFEKAKEYRLKLMEERKFHVKHQNEEKFERAVSLCEH